jgi:photosystem II stability/assembly factor-like uncharacterized protein
MRSWLALIVTLVGLAGTSSSSTVDPNLFKGMRWRNVGPSRGGRVTAVAGVAGQPLAYYFGGTGGGLWKTENAGISWTPVSDGYFKTGSVGAVEVAPSNANIIYVGMGEACLRANLSSGDGVYKSTDAGRTWTHVGLDDSSQIGRILIDPHNPDLVYVAAVGHPYGPNTERGVFRSKDGGKTWEKVLYVNEKTGAVDLSMDPTNSKVIYASAWQVLRTPWGIDSGGPGSGLYKTVDGGDHWTLLTDGLPASEKGKIGVSVSAADPNVVYAVVPAGVDHEEGGIYRSNDAGKTWRMMSNPPEVRLRDYYYGHIFADPKNVDTVYTFRKEFMKSTDGGRTWQELRVPHGDFHDLWIDPNDSRRMVNGNDGGATVTFDGGRSWSDLNNNQPTGQFYTVVTDDQVPYRLYGAQQDSTTVSVSSRAATAATEWYVVGGGESGHIAPIPDGSVVYAGSYFGKLTRYERRNGEVRDITVWPDYPGGRTAAQMKYRFQWTFPIVVSPHDSSVVYAGGNVLFRSTNGGRSWEAISPDLTRDDKQKENGGRLEESYCTIFAVTESVLQKGTIWVGSDDGLVHLTRDGGAHWLDVTPAAMPAWSRINFIEASPHDAGTAYLAVNRYQFDDFAPYIYKTGDYGKTWKLLTAGIPGKSFVRSVREDPKRRGLLYAGTETGVYVSFDDGENWQSLQLNLPVVPVTDLKIKNGDLVIATQGRSFWSLDDITPLEQSSDATVVLFHPRDAYRESGGGRGGQSGLTVAYFLKDKPAAPVTIEVADSSGRVITTRSGISADVGLNRFTWDMRFPDAHGIQGGTLLAGGNLRGPLAVPGTYKVTLRVGNQALTESAVIRRNPRFDSPQEDLESQFDFLIGVRDRLSEIHDAINSIRFVEKDISNSVLRAKEMPNGTQIVTAGEKLAADLESVLHELYEPRYTGQDDQMLIFPLKLNNRFAGLQGYVSGAEAAPTAQAFAVYQDLSKQLEGDLARLKTIRETDTAAFNRLLQTRGLPAIRW